MIDRLAIDCTATKPTEKRRKGHARKRIQAPLAPPPGARGPHPLTGHPPWAPGGWPGPALPSVAHSSSSGYTGKEQAASRTQPRATAGLLPRRRGRTPRPAARHPIRRSTRGADGEQRGTARHRRAHPQPPPPAIARVTSLATTGRRPSQPNIPRTAGRGPASSAGGTARPVGPSPSGRGALPRTVGFRRRARCLCLCRLQWFSSRRYGLIMSLVRGGAGGLPVSPSGYAGIAHT
ncbi:hypothetical protein PAHAL_2G324700 [Panicum hallii]|jgi:hypothetical protein|uniref:Uncharacterized protein n=1 Tax=Panicum hallii TaxID=206008 RepID=A0A2T8KR33_9POAL|nr:hypothetical protein PAHAL_2G324700 [Panicum hallii]